jgi:hypothetical protein
MFGVSFASPLSCRNITVVGERGHVVVDAVSPLGYKV